ncbi:MAG: hypothetical protein ACSNEK_09615 [Parachlamydiaceae bacterium]
MKEELLQLISLTELYLYDNHSFPKKREMAGLAPSSSPIPPPPLSNPAPKILPKAPPPPRSQEVKETAPLEGAKEPQIARKEAPIIKNIEKDYTDIANIFSKELPHVKLHKAPPKDDLAKATASAWMQKQPMVAIAIFTKNEKEKVFLRNIAESLSLRDIDVKLLIDNDIPKSANENLRFLLTTKDSIKLSEKLNVISKDGKIPICLMEEPSVYFNSPLKKAGLWRELLSLC